MGLVLVRFIITNYFSCLVGHVMMVMNLEKDFIYYSVTSIEKLENIIRDENWKAHIQYNIRKEILHHPRRIYKS